MAINKKTREAVYRKYGGRCAYCGRAIAYKDMQVDHFRPLRVWDEVDGAADDISNLMIRVMSAVSAKMAAERGIKRVPLAVLSQSEISRRMSAI